MPRGAKKSAHQHNHRHENGVVAPGKRIRKQKSNGHLNGVLDRNSPSPTPPSRSPSTSQPASLPDKSINGSATHAKTGFYEGVSAVGSRRVSHDLFEEAEMFSNGDIHNNGFAEHGHRKIDVNSAKNQIIPDGGILHLSLTILRSCPLGDTIAILIFLLSLPSTLITLTNALFAVLTFMPPAGSFSSFPATFSDVFQGSGGTPSLATILLTDTLGLVLWLVVWSPLQIVALELAQAVIATTLGGGNSNKGGGSDTTLLCMVIVSSAHVARHKWSAKRLFGYEWSANLPSLAYFSRSTPSFVGDDAFSTRSPAGWLRVLIALHILIQGLVHVARRWYTKREYTHTPPSGKKSDPEAVAGPHNSPEASIPADPNFLGPGTSSSAELRSKSSLSSLKDSREKVLSGKKKKKQGAYARNQQPLWAAFAATKVTILREYKKSHALSETMGSNATDTKNLGSAPFEVEDGCVWITFVNATSLCFDTSFFLNEDSRDHDLEDTDPPSILSIDRSKPVYVRINGADWTSTKIERIRTVKAEDESAGWRWAGEVHGLSPASSYICSFVRSEDDVVIHSLNVSTPSLPSDDQENPVFVTPTHQSQRPSSPTTPTATLKNSIAVLEASILESQIRQKRIKKESKVATLSLKKEIDTLNAKISKIGSEDKAQYNRHLQWNQHFRQADQAIAQISSEIDALGSVPEDDLDHWKNKKADWEESRELEASTREELLRSKESVQQEKSAVHAEAVTTQQKRERLQSRITKLNEQLDRVQSATNQGLDEKERREAEQTAKAADRQQIEERGREQLSSLQRSIQEVQYHTQQTWQQAQALESAHHQHQAMGSTGQTGRITPEGDLLGNNHPHTPISGFRFPAFTTAEHSAPLLGNHFSLRYENRPRSTSLLSGNSVYTDFSDQDPAPPMPSSRAMEAVRGRQPSGSSGSGSIGSQRDLMSPVAGTAPIRSPAVKKSSPVWN